MILSGTISVKAALQQQKREVKEIFFLDGRYSRDLSYIRALAAKAGVPCHYVSREELDRLSGHLLCNDPSRYEAEIRLLVRKDGMLIPLLKLMTLPDGRFSYRRETVAASLSPVNAALAVKLAAPWLKEGARVLDPFCGVGTLLIERMRLTACAEVYGTDLFGEAVLKARQNAERARAGIRFINRDFFDFTHDRLFDEVISDLPFMSEQEEAFGRKLGAALAAHLNEGAAVILYTPEAPALLAGLEEDGRFALQKRFLINDRNRTEVLVLCFGTENHA